MLCSASFCASDLPAATHGRGTHQLCEAASAHVRSLRAVGSPPRAAQKQRTHSPPWPVRRCPAARPPWASRRRRRPLRRRPAPAPAARAPRRCAPAGARRPAPAWCWRRCRCSRGGRSCCRSSRCRCRCRCAAARPPCALPNAKSTPSSLSPRSLLRLAAAVGPASLLRARTAHRLVPLPSLLPLLPCPLPLEPLLASGALPSLLVGSSSSSLRTMSGAGTSCEAADGRRAAAGARLRCAAPLPLGVLALAALVRSAKDVVRQGRPGGGQRQRGRAGGARLAGARRHGHAEPALHACAHTWTHPPKDGAAAIATPGRPMLLVPRSLCSPAATTRRASRCASARCVGAA